MDNKKLKDTIYFSINKIETNKKLLDNAVDKASTKGFFNKRERLDIAELIEDICLALSDIEDEEKRVK